MFEKVNPCHPDKVADRIAGAIVDLAYSKINDPKIAVEVLLGHGNCTIIIETDCKLNKSDITKIVHRITRNDELKVHTTIVAQDSHLNKNQAEKFKCGDNGIFKGVPVTLEQITLSNIARDIYAIIPFDGKYILDGDRLIVCQSHTLDDAKDIQPLIPDFPNAEINPIGIWTGGSDVDSGATNRKLGSDMADSVTGGGLHGKDLSKADVSINIYAWLKAQELGRPVEFCCAIGDEIVDGKPYSEIVEIAREFIKDKGGFEKFAEWGFF